MRERVASSLRAEGRNGRREVTICTFHALASDHSRRRQGAGLKPGFSISDRRHRADRGPRLVATSDGRGASRAVADLQWKNALVPRAAAPLRSRNRRGAGRGARLRRYDDALRRYQAWISTTYRLPVALLAAATAARSGGTAAPTSWSTITRTPMRAVPILRPPRGGRAAVHGGSATTTRRSTAGAARTLDNLGAAPAGLSGAEGRQARADYRRRCDPALRERAHRQQPEALRQAAVERARHGEPDPRSRRRPTTRPRRKRSRGASWRTSWGARALRRLRDSLPGQPPGKAFEKALREHNVPTPFRAGSRGSIDEIKDVVAYLRLVANDDDDPAFIGRSRRPSGHRAAALEKLGAIAGSRHESLFAAPFPRKPRPPSRRGSGKSSPSSAA